MLVDQSLLLYLCRFEVRHHVITLLLLLFPTLVKGLFWGSYFSCRWALLFLKIYVLFYLRNKYIEIYNYFLFPSLCINDLYMWQLGFRLTVERISFSLLSYSCFSFRISFVLLGLRLIFIDENQQVTSCPFLICLPPWAVMTQFGWVLTGWSSSTISSMFGWSIRRRN